MLAFYRSLSFRQKAMYFIAGLLVFRLLHLLLLPGNLAGDEAYYWDWGRRPDYGYYSKPPLIAWLYALADWIGSGSVLGIRITSLFLCTISLIALYFLAQHLFNEEVAWVACFLAAAAPANAVLGFFLTIDAPLVFFWTVSLWMLWRWIDGRGNAATLIILFVALGLGHLTKQMMLIFPILALIYILLRSDRGEWLKKPTWWLVLFGSYLALAPPMIWNAQNGWITFEHSKHHFSYKTEGGFSVSERIVEFFSFLFSQFGVLSPATAVLLFCLALAGLFFLKKSSDPVRFCLVFCSLPLLVVLFLAMRQRVQPNWPAVFYTTGIILVAAWLCGKTQLTFPSKKIRLFCNSRFSKWVFIIGTVLLHAYFYFGGEVFRSIGKDGHVADPNRRLLSHEILASEFQKVRSHLPDWEKVFLSSFGHRDTVSHLAFNLPDQPRVYNWNLRGGINSQYDMWPDPSKDGQLGHDGLLLVPYNTQAPTLWAENFDSVKKVGEFTVRYRYDHEVPFYVFCGKNLHQWKDGDDVSMPAATENDE